MRPVPAVAGVRGARVALRPISKAAAWSICSAGPSRLHSSSSSSSTTSPRPSHAYAPSLNSPSDPSRADNPATQSTALSPEAKSLLDRILRVDQAGELGANWIYRGQLFSTHLRGDHRTAKEIKDMWANEKHHLHVAHLLGRQHGARPTALWPLWQVLAWGLGAGTGLMGREGAMACTEAVETVIGEHYDDQLAALQPLLQPSADGTPPHPSLPLLAEIIKEFRDDELEHLDAAVEGGAQKAPGHALLSAIVGFGCKAAIKVCEKI